MDNKISSQIKRGLIVSKCYLISLTLFAVFMAIILSVFPDSIEKATLIYSFVMFLVLFSFLYNDLFSLASKEKRPQYNINPSPYKGLLYGFIGIIPIFIIQLLYYFFTGPEEIIFLKRRILQIMTGPLYWLARIIGNEIWAYHIVLLLVPVLSLLSYMAGYYDLNLFKKKAFKKNKK